MLVLSPRSRGSNCSAGSRRLEVVRDLGPAEQFDPLLRGDGTLKTELLYELPLQTNGATRSAVADYIESFYNVRRRHSSLGYQSPVEFELKNGEPGGSAPGPPMIDGRGRGQEMPGLPA